MLKQPSQVVELSGCTYCFDVREGADGERVIVISGTRENQFLRFAEQDLDILIGALSQLKKQLVAESQHYRAYDQNRTTSLCHTWTVKLDNDLIDAYSEGAHLEDIAECFGLEVDMIRARLEILAVL